MLGLALPDRRPRLQPANSKCSRVTSANLSGSVRASAARRMAPTSTRGLPRPLPWPSITRRGRVGAGVVRGSAALQVLVHYTASLGIALHEDALLLMNRPLLPELVDGSAVARIAELYDSMIEEENFYIYRVAHR